MEARMGMLEKAVTEMKLDYMQKLSALDSRVAALENQHRHADRGRSGTRTDNSLYQDLSGRLSRLESIEEEHSWLLVMKGKADAETYEDINTMKEHMQIVDGKVSYCLTMLDSDSADEGEEEEGADTDPEDNH